MKLTEALQIIQKTPAQGDPFPAVLACGFTPLHLQTFFHANLQLRLPGRRVTAKTGLYGDLVNTVARLETEAPHAAGVVIEWSDLDARLGFRQLGGWDPAKLGDIVEGVGTRLGWLEAALQRIPASTRVAVSLPTLALPPMFFTRQSRADEIELRLRHLLAEFAARIGANRNVHVVSEQLLALESPAGSRFDFKGELFNGFPYTMAHGAAVGAALAQLIAPPAPKKGLITDLDDTMWLGIVGEIGAGAVKWDLAGHAQIHGLYQQTLRALAEQGVLLAVASKNNPQPVEEAFARPDFMLPQEKVFPFEVHWNRKSESVSRILETWNIGADSVVFIDDNPMEVDEVKNAHPAVECVLFPKSDYAAAHRLLYQLREWFAKDGLSAEDALRLQSIRAGAVLRDATQGGGSSPEEFLSRAEAVVTVEFADSDPRVLELVNKTNQFNLNGVRYTEPEWAALQARPGAFVASVSYTDKYGALGKIAVISGQATGRQVVVHTWVMSCRAFSRRIEHRCLQVLFTEFDALEIQLQFQATPKNGPTQDLLRELQAEVTAAAAIQRQDFEKLCPVLYHEVRLPQPVS